MDGKPEPASDVTRDTELAAALENWVSAADPDVVAPLGPFDAEGMDPSWVVHFTGHHLEADASLFRGAYLDVSASKPGDVQGSFLVGGEGELTAARLIAMLNDLAAASQGSPTPPWLRVATT
jgi:hypothetical protein